MASHGHHQPFRDRFCPSVNGPAPKKASSPSILKQLKRTPGQKLRRSRKYFLVLPSWSAALMRMCLYSLGWALKAHLRRPSITWQIADALYFDHVYRFVSKPRLLRQRYIHVILGEITAA
jgi:hypothetical protein